MRRPIGEFRTTKQIEADKLDLECFRVVARLDRFANEFRDEDVREMAVTVDAMRNRVRQHMHAIDRKEKQQ